MAFIDANKFQGPIVRPIPVAYLACDLAGVREFRMGAPPSETVCV